MSCHDPKEALLSTLQAPRRNRYFYGKRLDVQHMQMEQDHGQHKQWMLNRLTVGKGVVCGLHVAIDNNRLCVSPGMAIDGLGREIVVPVRACIDPFAPNGGCDCTPGATPRPDPKDDPQPGGPKVDPSGPVGLPGTPAAPANAADAAQPIVVSDDLVANPRRGTLATLWLCYHECSADPQATMVSDCNSSATCTPGTTVETFCLKVLPGVPPLQGDPDFCAHLWPQAQEPKPDPSAPLPSGPGDLTTASTAALAALVRRGLDGSAGAERARDLQPAPAAGQTAKPSELDVARARRSRRHLLCELFDDCCDPSDGDVCVPLALVGMDDGRITHVESCLVRPRIYSNAQLLDLILCLADKIDDCCGQKHPPAPNPAPPAPEPAPPAPEPEPLMRVAGIDFLRREDTGAELLIASVSDPTSQTPVSIGRNVNAIRIKFTAPFAQDAHIPSTHVHADPDYKRHNVQVLPQSVLDNLEYVPGTLDIEGADSVRFDLFPDSPYVRGNKRGWQKGGYVIYLRGNDATASGQPALVDMAGKALDGEAIAPNPPALSGDGTAGGDFKTLFVVG
jgi:hypothetical protein